MLNKMPCKRKGNKRKMEFEKNNSFNPKEDRK